ncbi:hypothetical protein [Glycomyces paridis]|uniref:Uncharacterized protein n=1 Tax=Glycomyces paridis TaxID=2126555 RepID=A0A4S8PHB1_9ACTN|nr:hypothetical protein [Glycomyces paridis]THV30008.1 hypothetical protein E9998_06385 [Glycomyces paridis]
MNDIDLVPIRRTTRGAARLTVIAGWAVVAIGLLHIAAIAPSAAWADWFDGSLRVLGEDWESIATFWALPGGLAVPVILLGLLMIRFGRQRQAIGLWFPVALLAWVSFCVWLIGPSGFMLVSVPVVLLVVAAVLDRKASVDRP